MRPTIVFVCGFVLSEQTINLGSCNILLWANNRLKHWATKCMVHSTSVHQEAQRIVGQATSYLPNNPLKLWAKLLSAGTQNSVTLYAVHAPLISKFVSSSSMYISCSVSFALPASVFFFSQVIPALT